MTCSQIYSNKFFKIKEQHFNSTFSSIFKTQSTEAELQNHNEARPDISYIILRHIKNVNHKDNEMNIILIPSHKNIPDNKNADKT